MSNGGIFRRVDAVSVPVPDLDTGLRFYDQALGHRLKWRNDRVGQAGLELPDGDSELVLTTRQSYEPNWLVDNVDHAVALLIDHGCDLVAAPFDIPVGRAGAVRDPFGNTLVLVDLSKGTFPTDPQLTRPMIGRDTRWHGSQSRASRALWRERAVRRLLSPLT